MSQERPKIRMNYDPSEDPGIEFEKQGRTHQSFRDECDLNVLMKRYEKTGQLPEMIRDNPRYGDFSSVPDYQQACEIVSRANEQFDGLDAHLRERFNNDPEKFLAFTHDARNIPEMIKLGLAVARPAPQSAGDPLSGAQKPSGKPPKGGKPPSPAAPDPSDDE